MSQIEQEKNQSLEGSKNEKHPQGRLTVCTMVGYSLGHVFNDLCAGVWFNFLLFYVTKVICLPPSISGLVMLSGQIADGLMTPLVGLCSDRTNTSCGKRTPWYLFGTALVTPSFFGLFWECALCQVNSLSYNTASIIYYTTLPALFNIGWASVQISNMSLIAQLTLSKRRRDSLVGYRTAATYASNFLVLLISLIIFISSDNSQSGFKFLDISVTSIGLLCSILYLLLVPQIKYSRLARQNYFNSSSISTTQQPNPVSWKEWLSRCQVFIMGGVYMFSRLSINVFTSLTPFYLQDVLGIGNGGGQSPLHFQLALVPMISFTFSSLASLFLVKPLYRRFNGRFYPYIVGTLLLSLGLSPLLFLNSSFSWPIYLSSCVIGASFSLFLNISISCIVSLAFNQNDVVGQNPESGAFVFGFFSFLDKISNGAVLFLISTYGLSSPDRIRYQIVVITLCSSYLGSILLYFGSKRMNSSSLVKEEHFERPLIEGIKSNQIETLEQE